jgi:hypothetical protein
MAITFLVLSLLAMGWLGLRERVARLDESLAFHVSTYQRDQRKARFYFRSVWTGLVAAFVSLACLDLIANAAPESTSFFKAVVGVAYGIGLWGVLVIGLVWTQVGRRVREPNSDGQSLTPLKERKK